MTGDRALCRRPPHRQDALHVRSALCSPHHCPRPPVLGLKRPHPSLRSARSNFCDQRRRFQPRVASSSHRRPPICFSSACARACGSDVRHDAVCAQVRAVIIMPAPNKRSAAKKGNQNAKHKPPLSEVCQIAVASPDPQQIPLQCMLASPRHPASSD